MVTRWILGSIVAGVMLTRASVGICAESGSAALSHAAVAGYPAEAVPQQEPGSLPDRPTPRLIVADSGGTADVPPVYRPPDRGAPESRVSGGSRGADPEAARVFVLAPQATGETMTATPTLYWFVSDPVKAQVEVTLTERNVAAPLLDVTLDPPTRAGIFGLSLADAHVALAPGTEYRWSVALVVDPAQREKDIMSGAGVRYVEAPSALRQKLNDAPARSRPAILANASLWYDALAALAAEMSAEPASKAFHIDRAALLEQVGLTEVASFDRSR